MDENYQSQDNKLIILIYKILLLNQISNNEATSNNNSTTHFSNSKCRQLISSSFTRKKEINLDWGRWKALINKPRNSNL